METKEKRGALHGGALTDEVLASSRRVLSRNRGGSSFKGLQQNFTPPEAARLVADVFGNASAVLDPTAGNGSLLAGLPEGARFGIEIDADHAKEASYEAIQGDAQRVVPMLRSAGARFPGIALNPPFGLGWRDTAHGAPEINSTKLAFLWGLDLMDGFGQGAMICGRDRLAKEIGGLPQSRGIYALVEVEGEFFEGVALPIAIAFFVQPKNRVEDRATRQVARKAARFKATRLELPRLADEIKEARFERTKRVTTFGNRDRLREAYGVVRSEHDRRRKAEASKKAKLPRYDVALRGRRIHAVPGAYAKMALAAAYRQREIETLNGQALEYFGQNPRAWKQVEEAEANAWITVDPALKDRIATIREDARLQSTPLFPLRAQMRLGWLTDLEVIRCVKDDPTKGYVAGEDYPVSTRTKVASEIQRRVVESSKKEGGEPDLRQFTVERKLLVVQIGNGHAYTQEGNGFAIFDEGPESIAYLAEHFDLPDPGCVKTRHPEKVAANRELLLEIASDNGFSFKEFQVDHLSRLLVKGRGMLAHEQGLGKTMMLMSLAEAEERRGANPCALFVVPQDLIPQWQREANKFFGRTMEVIKNPAQARRVAREVKAGRPGWFITYYEALSIVGRKSERLPETPLDPKVYLANRLALYKHRKRRISGVPFNPDEQQYVGEISPATEKDGCPNCQETDTSHGWVKGVCDNCGYVHRRIHVRSAASHLGSAFERGVVCVDEVSEMRGDDSLRSKAIRALARGPHKYGGTGTPLSNYVNDSFWGLWFCLGNASAAFPYDYHEGKAKFEADFCVIEYMMGEEKKGENHLRKRRKVLPQVTNVSQFWRLTQPGVSRCRKEQTGEPLVERTYHPIRVPMGKGQQKMHAFWLKNFASYFTEKYPLHPLVEHGLVEKWAAALGQLWRLETAATLPESDEPTREWWYAKDRLGALSNYTPAALKVLELAMEHASRGEKVLIGSDLILTGKWFADRLAEKGVRSVHITEERAGKVGTKNPRKRAGEITDFVDGDAQVLCAGVNAMKLGHNLDVASTVIVHGLPYSHMALDQFVARVHRLTSKRPVSVYVVVPKGSLAQRKWDLLKDKGGASDLAFDGELSLQPEDAVDWSKVLKDMKERGIRAEGDEILESDVEAAWKEVPKITAPGSRRHRRRADEGKARLVVKAEVIPEREERPKREVVAAFEELSLF